MIFEGLPREKVRSIAAQTAAGLAAAHEQHLVHGDLKPANILVTSEGVAKILDFGLARSQPSTVVTSTTELTSTPSADTRRPVTPDYEDQSATVDVPANSSSSAYDRTVSDNPMGIRGTPAYMSPEQLTGQTVVLASDTFSFGLILYEMLAGQRALGDDSLVEILSKLSSDELARQLAAQVGREYRDLLASLLARDPMQRPAISDVASWFTSEPTEHRP